MRATRMAPGGSNKKLANSLVTLSSAAILTIYAAGLMKTRAAAEQLDDARSPAIRVSPVTTPAVSPPPPAPVNPDKTAEPAPVEAAPAPVKPAPAPVAVGTIPTAAAPPVATVATVKPPEAAPAAATTTTPAPAAELAAAEKPAPLLRPKEIYMDGTYLGWGTSRHGDIQASVKIEDGRIVSSTIARCLTRYSCSWVAHLPGQVVSRQAPDVDYVSGATESANAFYWAVIDALNKAK